MEDLRGRVVVITGAGGIGSETALAFAREGCHVALCDIREQRLEEAREKLGKYAPEALTMVADVSDGSQMRRFVDAAAGRWGRLDLLVNNAAYGMHRPFIKVGADEMQAQLQTNYMGAVHATKAALEHMLPAESGHVVNVVSVVAKLPVPNSGNYAATKAALDSLTLTLRAELAEHGIEVTAVYPTATRNTNFFTTSGSNAEQTRARRFMKEPSEVAAAIVKAARSRKPELHVGLQSRALPVLRALLPSGVRLALERVARVYR
ncbi:SDR family NAD(P)-dependent oxidoreductase [Rubrobacter aplysinae]|uniref:SDR family NAD(P)-dependent oxidoreductase n=1 Tax=Rubrobacter aplysinae TaxID=909625 RepID=UPI00064BB181|nr:SDR family NAD(P)-dependent oxidoreductase [Rubrobacter aplysinae]